MARDKEETKQKLIDAVGRIVVRDGFQSVGINAVAKEAAVDKVLIYRYFGDIDGLLKAFESQKDYFVNIKNSLGSFDDINQIEDFLDITKKIYIGQLREIMKNKELKEMLLWELNHKNIVTGSVAADRENVAVSFVEAMQGKFDFGEMDLNGVLSILAASVYYLTIRSKTVDVFTGIDLTSDEGWDRIEKSIEFILDSVMKNIPSK